MSKLKFLHHSINNLFWFFFCVCVFILISEETVSFVYFIVAKTKKTLDQNVAFAVVRINRLHILCSKFQVTSNIVVTHSNKTLT